MTPSKIKQVVAQGLKEAHKRHGEGISFCGFAESWDECLTWFERSQGETQALFQYNVGVNTHAVTITV